MALHLKCDACEKELDEPGGLLFSPLISPHKTVHKYHLCVLCYEKVMNFLAKSMLSKPCP